MKALNNLRQIRSLIATKKAHLGYLNESLDRLADSDDYRQTRAIENKIESVEYEIKELEIAAK